MNPSVTPKATVHDRKRRKNLAVLLLVLGWCALIFMITMAKLTRAHAQADVDAMAPAPAATPYSGQRMRHEEKIHDTEGDVLQQRKDHQQAMDNTDMPPDDDRDFKPLATPAQGTKGPALPPMQKLVTQPIQAGF